MSEEKRMSPVERHPVALEAALRTGGQVEACWVAEVAAREVLVVTDQTYPVHQLVAVEMMLPDATQITVHGMISAILEAEADEGEESLTGVRVEFYGLVDWTRDAWEGFLKSLGVVFEEPASADPVPLEKKKEGGAVPIGRIAIPLAKKPAESSEETRDSVEAQAAIDDSDSRLEPEGSLEKAIEQLGAPLEEAAQEAEGDDEEEVFDLSLIIDVNSAELQAAIADEPAGELSLEIGFNTDALPTAGAEAGSEEDEPAESIHERATEPPRPPTPAEPSLSVDVDSAEFRPPAAEPVPAEPSLSVDVDSAEFRPPAVEPAPEEPSLTVDVDSMEFRAVRDEPAPPQPAPVEGAGVEVLDRGAVAAEMSGEVVDRAPGSEEREVAPSAPPPWARDASLLMDKGDAPPGAEMKMPPMAVPQVPGHPAFGRVLGGGAPPGPGAPAAPPRGPAAPPHRMAPAAAWRPVGAPPARSPAPAPAPTSRGLAVYRLHLPNPQALDGFVQGPMSAGGIFVRTPDVRPPGTPAVVAIVHPASRDEFHMPGQIVPSSGGGGVSVRFTRMSPKTVGSFRHFVDAGFRGPGPAPARPAPAGAPAPQGAPPPRAPRPGPPVKQENTMEVSLKDLGPLIE